MTQEFLTINQLERYQKMGAGGLVEAYLDLATELDRLYVLTKREQFVMAAMQGLAASGKWHETKVPRQAVKMADALLAELASGKEQGDE